VFVLSNFQKEKHKEESNGDWRENIHVFCLLSLQREGNEEGGGKVTTEKKKVQKKRILSRLDPRISGVCLLFLILGLQIQGTRCHHGNNRDDSNLHSMRLYLFLFFWGHF